MAIPLYRFNPMLSLQRLEARAPPRWEKSARGRLGRRELGQGGDGSTERLHT